MPNTQACMPSGRVGLYGPLAARPPQPPPQHPLLIAARDARARLGEASRIEHTIHTQASQEGQVVIIP